MYIITVLWNCYTKLILTQYLEKDIVAFSMWQPVPVTYCIIFKNLNILVIYIFFHADVFVALGCVLF